MKSLSLLTAVSIAALAAVPSVVSAQHQQKTLYVAGYGGSFEKTIRDEVIPAFEKANSIKVEYVAGNSTDTLAKLQAQKGNQQIDVAIVDDGPMYQAIQLGFCGKVDGLSADLYNAARFKDDRAVAIGTSAKPMSHWLFSTQSITSGEMTPKNDRLRFGRCFRKPPASRGR